MLISLLSSTSITGWRYVLIGVSSSEEGVKGVVFVGLARAPRMSIRVPLFLLMGVDGSPVAVRVFLTGGLRVGCQSLYQSFALLLTDCFSAVPLFLAGSPYVVVFLTSDLRGRH